MGITAEFNIQAQSYFGRDIQVIFPDRLGNLVHALILDETLRRAPLFGSLSQVGNFCVLSDAPEHQEKIKQLYE